MKNIQTMLGCTYAATLLACSSLGGMEPAQEGMQVQEIGNMDRLAPAEQAAYVDDLQYLYQLTRPGVAVELNYADPRQYNLVLMRLKLTGKNPDNSPYLFELIEARRQDHIARQLKAGTFATQPAIQSLTVAGLGPEHFIEKGQLKKKDSSYNEISGTGTTSFPGGTFYTRVDVSGTTTSGGGVTPVVAKEEYASAGAPAGTNELASTSGKIAAWNTKRYVVGSFKYEERQDGTFSSTFVKTEVGSGNPTVVGPAVALSPVTVTAPLATILPPNDLISVCMDRSWTTDCDYILNTGNPWGLRIKMPLAGSASVTSNHVIDTQRIEDIKWALNQEPPQDPGGEVGSFKLILTNVGGGCDVTDGNTLYAPMKQFWNQVTVSADKKTISWNLTGDKSAFFDEGCRQIQNVAKLTAFIPLRIATVPPDAPKTVDTSITITSDPLVDRRDYLLNTITLTNSCLAEGTQIQLSNGRLASVESLQIGQKVFNPYDREDHALVIMDTAKGSERAPMVRIRDEAGRTLLMTEMHPIATPDRGMVQARSLRTGDVVMTKQGPSKLTEVSREPYDGQVYNLKVGSKSEMASLGQDQTIVYANGFVVGDGQIQSKYEALGMKQETRAIGQIPVSEIPEKWRRDYLRSPHRE